MLSKKKHHILPFCVRLLLMRTPLQVTGTPKALREYSLQGQTATGGINGCWNIFSAKARKEGKPPDDRVISIRKACTACSSSSHGTISMHIMLA